MSEHIAAIKQVANPPDHTSVQLSFDFHRHRDKARLGVTKGSQQICGREECFGRFDRESSSSL